MRVIVAGGGTGGHVIPGLAIARELRARYRAEVQFMGTRRGIEVRLVPAAGFTLRLIEVGALKNVSPATRARTLLGLPRALLDAAAILREFRPQVVLGVGGYASGPGMAAAAIAGIPILAFEPNVVPGFANRVAAPLVAAAAVQFPETARYFRHAQVSGVPVRPEFFALPWHPQGMRPTLLVFGGSQGARALNRILLEALPMVYERIPGLHIVHQTGERDYNEAQSAYLRARASADIFPFIDNMPQAFARAGLLLCRSGASTVAEIAAAGKPAIFVPFPRAADDHQRRNAEALERKGAAVMVPEAELTPQRLVEMVSRLLNDPERLAAMGAAARALAHPHAAAQIAHMTARLAGEQPVEQESIL